MKISLLLLLLLFSSWLLAGCGGANSAPPPPLTNPVPTIAAISPNNATRGGPAFTLTVNGSNFASGAALQWNGSNRLTTFVNASQVTAQIGADDISVAGTDPVTLINPSPRAATPTPATSSPPSAITTA